MPDKFRDVSFECNDANEVSGVRAFCVQCQSRLQPEFAALARDAVMARCQTCNAATVLFMTRDGAGY